ncbi:MAG: hypothetical protein JWO31_3170 [Phycisphaerales bacterium]|nr:hypothetical protein [Phycisphaerales bacterium]
MRSPSDTPRPVHSRRHVLRWVAAAAVAAGFGPAALAQTVTVQQVEAFENSPTNTHYAPVNFNGSSTTTDPTNFPGITFRAQANTTDTASSHAFFVGQRFYGSGSPAVPYVNSVYAQSAGNFINGLNTQSAPGAAQPLPGGFGNGIKVSNHSYVADFGTAAADENAVRRIDYVVNNEDVVFAAGAVTGGTFANQNLVWSARNSLAVRGDSPATPFDPSASANTVVSGKRRADLWSDEEASYATGRVSGYATGLVGQAQAGGQTNAVHNQVVRSLLMTGADTSATGSVVSAWTRDTANNLDVDAGAGKADYARSLSILNGGARALQTVSGGATANVASASLRGWAYGMSTTGQQAVVISAPTGIDALAATLNWNVTQSSTAVTIDTSDAGRIFPDLALELRPATLSGGQYVLGAAIGRVGLTSNAALDNVEHLYFTSAGGGGPWAAGSYAFVITGVPARTTNIGFSYDFTASNVPEPTAVLLAAPVALGLVARRRRQTSP